MLEKRIYHSDQKLGSKWKPILVGSNVNRYDVSYEKFQYIKYGANLMYASNENKMIAEKILLRQTSDKIRACIEKRSFYCQNSLFIISSPNLNLSFLLGLLNSKLFDFLYQSENPQKGKVFAEIKPSVIKALPIKIIDQANQSVHDKILHQVDTMLELKKQLQSTRTPAAQQQLENRIAYTDKKIDELVYELYGLNEEEIGIIEGAV